MAGSLYAETPPVSPVVGVTYLDQLSFAILMLAPAVFLSVPRGINLCLFALFVLAVADIVRRLQRYRMAMDTVTWLLLLSFAALFLATGITQWLRTATHWPSFDGPVRILMAGAVFLFLRQRRLSAVRAFEIGIPLGLLLLLGAVWLARDARVVYGGRYTTAFVDPNTLGSQATILTFLCLVSLGLFGREKLWLLILKAAGVVAGIYVSLHAQSRGGWMAIVPMLLLWIALRRKAVSSSGWQHPAALLGLAALASFAVLGLSDQAAGIGNRLGQAYDEIINWLLRVEVDSASGRRLSMWEISLLLAKGSPWVGYGETGFATLLANHPLNAGPYRMAVETLIRTGPHSDVLAKLLSMGLIGLLAYVLTLAAPAALFWRRRSAGEMSVRVAALFGLIYLSGLAVSGLANEMLSLKYLCSFFGLMMAALCADAVRRPDPS